jgi:hypothetical protein
MYRVLTLVFVTLALAWSGSLHAHGVKTKELEIVHPWTREPGPQTPTEAVVGMTIRNKGRSVDRLIAVETPSASKAEIVVAGAALDSPLRIAPGSTVSMPGDGVHIRLVGLAKPLHAHDDFRMTLIFEKAGRIVVEVYVEEATASPPHKH